MLADALDLNPDDIPTLGSEDRAPVPSSRPSTQTNPALTKLKSSASTFHSSCTDSKSEMRSEARAEQLQGLLVKVLQVGPSPRCIGLFHTEMRKSAGFSDGETKTCPWILHQVFVLPGALGS